MAGEVCLHFDLPPHFAAELFLLSGIPCYDQTPLENGYECRIEQKDLRRVEALCAQRELPFRILKTRGFAKSAKKALRRPGLILGLLLALFLTFESSRYVWDIEVYGNETLTKEEIVGLLADNGFYIGCRHTSLDLHILCNDLPRIDGRIAWISVNMIGALAEVQVYETRDRPGGAKEGGLPVNLVAAKEGEIVRFELTGGRPVVGVGQTVETGQLLVAGYSEKETGLFPRASSGRVFAKTVIEESVFIPYEQTVITHGEPVLLEKSANILGKRIFFYKKGLQSGEKYDIVNDEYRPTVLSVALPFRVTAVCALPQIETAVTLTPAEALERAKEALNETLRAKTGEVLSRSYSYKEQADGVWARVTAVAVVDIAVRVEVEDPFPGA